MAGFKVGPQIPPRKPRPDVFTKYIDKEARLCYTFGVVRNNKAESGKENKMIQQRATKKQTADLILRAKRDGWSIEADTMLDSAGRPWLVSVSMHKAIYFANGYLNERGHIIVSVRMNGARHVTSITALSHDRKYRGLWNANYILRTMREAEQRQNERNQQKS